ncbi:MAG: YchF family ATPase [Anaerolineales bacterium]|nr:YchF family ATPase [Anaerolineales bacterium]
MRLGIIGLEASGKTTVFNSLTGAQLETGTMAGHGRMEVHAASVDVPDARLDAVSDVFNPQKTTNAKVTYADIGGMNVGAGREGLPGPLINQIEQMDGLLLVVRAFQDPGIPSALGEIDPARDAAALDGELLLSDMVTVERRLDKLQEERQKGGRERAAIEREQAIFERAAAHLNQEQPLRRMDLTIDDRAKLSGFGLLTLIPILIVVNLGENQSLPDLGEIMAGEPVLGLQGKLEMEIAQLPADQAAEFLVEYGIEVSGRERVIRSSYETLGLHSFFTGNKDEVRAWTLTRGGTCLDAAETIHSDMARGFIRAEVINWEALVSLGGLAEARAQGKLRLEGKDAVVSDGDVIYIRFNV